MSLEFDQFKKKDCIILLSSVCLEVSHINLYYGIYTNFISKQHGIIYDFFFNARKANVGVEGVLIMQQLQVYKTEIGFTVTNKWWQANNTWFLAENNNNNNNNLSQYM